MRKSSHILALAALVLGASAHAASSNEASVKEQTAAQAAKLGLSGADISKMQKDALGVVMARPEIRAWGMGLQNSGASVSANLQTVIKSSTDICHLIKLAESKPGRDKPTPKSTWQVCAGKAEQVVDDEAAAADKKAVIGQALVNGPIQAAVLGVVSAVSKKSAGLPDEDEAEGKPVKKETKASQHKEADHAKGKKSDGAPKQD